MPEKGRFSSRAGTSPTPLPIPGPVWGSARFPRGAEFSPDLTVAENLLMGAYTEGDRKTISTRMEEAFKLFPILKERQNQVGKTLSGGEQQMLAIARALMARPRVMLMDEVSLGLMPILRGRDLPGDRRPAPPGSNHSPGGAERPQSAGRG